MAFSLKNKKQQENADTNRTEGTLLLAVENNSDDWVVKALAL